MQTWALVSCQSTSSRIHYVDWVFSFFKISRQQHTQLEVRAVLQIRARQQSLTASVWPLTTHIYHVMIMVTVGFSKKSIFIIFRSSHKQMFSRTGVIGNFTIFTGKHLCWGPFLIKLQALGLQLYFNLVPKETSTLCIEHLWWLLLSV